MILVCFDKFVLVKNPKPLKSPRPSTSPRTGSPRPGIQCIVCMTNSFKIRILYIYIYIYIYLNKFNKKYKTA